MDPYISVENVSHVYSNGVTAIKDIDLDIYEKEVVAILGSNGSGKTTLVKHFNGLLTPTKGKITVGNLNTKKEKVSKLSSLVGYVFQNPNHQTFLPKVSQELSYGCKNLKMSEEETEERVNKAVELFELHDRLDENPFDLNSSQRKEVAMASIMAISPQVIILDEPTTGQDHKGCKRVLELVRMFRDHGHIVVLITHDMHLIGELNCRTVVMHQSEKIADDQADVVFADKEIMGKAGLQPPQITSFANELSHLDQSKTYLTIHSILESMKANKKESVKVASRS
ncbi:energy-coupling factor ABC transporter ATP-binding protein [Halobacillus naozhouensis]|uniref:Energy-coupling factor ABC transporter ATP-binding protein n=1 Tax=Halobacillus naozhouensis TaxID=554880 RepID=A0ABY8IWS1_9BACI|nr:energy-coupling factor ABC transporter ATP-binding protein [Halobacillus naozhouensis]WFT74272.1 energy-coupling factor ABC transporter ATP-binding protein [Halobacillus naozhouensis]